jgi:hypothetical protein
MFIRIFEIELPMNKEIVKARICDVVLFQSLIYEQSLCYNPCQQLSMNQLIQI